MMKSRIKQSISKVYEIFWRKPVSRKYEAALEARGKKRQME